MIFFLTFFSISISRRPKVIEYVQFAHPSPRIYDNAIGCDMCNKIVAYIHKLLNDKTVESEIESLLESFCATFPSPYDTLCKALTESYVPTIIEWIDQGITSNEICTKFGFCSSEKKVSRKFPGRIAIPKDKKYLKGTGCDLCKKLVEYVEQLLEDKTIDDELVNLAKQLCATFPSPYDSLCSTVVGQYLPFIIKWIDQGLQSSDICKTIGLCETKLRKAVRIPSKLALPDGYQNGVGCDMCKKVVQYIEQLLKDQKTEEEIALLVEEVCKFFPSPYDSLCDSICEQYVPAIMQYIEQGIEVLDICSSLGLCSTNKIKKANTKRKVYGKMALPSPRIYDNSIGCDMCKKVIQYIEQLLKDEKVEEEIAQLVSSLCTNFPSPYDSLCKGIVELYIPQIIEYIEKDMEVLDICSTIGLCSPSQNKKVVKKRVVYGKMALPSPRIYDNSIGCDMCKKVIQYIEQLLKDEKVEEEIAQLVSSLCTNFPSPYDSLCKGIVELYVPQIIEYIEKDMEVLDICSTIGLCSEEIVSKIKKQRARTTTVNHRQQKKHTYISNSEETCETCKKWFKWATDKLSDITIEGLWKLIHEECPKVPYLKYFCEIINEQNIKTFVDLIVAQAPPEKACGWTHLC
ncbi:hypothetical protein M9Y10_021254 [Tritrichomonas musculus]|uniref:Saposin B-type domain-containing protein n=1 Tax=Tritrichomonas musculus TaxID=1915356 RepID=A0ABR2HEC7_9EUKA